MDENSFTIDEIKRIERNLGFITRDWSKSLIGATIRLAMQKDVSILYWNSSETIDSGNTHEQKIDFFYERLPKQMGFKQIYVNLRGKGQERLWYTNLKNEKFSSQNVISLSQIPQNYQGAVINLLGHRGPYSKEELKNVLNIINKEPKSKKIESFSYKTKNWSGAQRFRNDRDEIVLTQRLTKETFDNIINSDDPALQKFMYLLYEKKSIQHFEQGLTGFILISPISSTIWLINEIQTDNLNVYIKIKNNIEQKQKTEEQVLDEQVIKDMLESHNKSIWIPKLTNEKFLKQIQENPNFIDSLPNNEEIQKVGSIDEWININKESPLTLILAKNYKIIKLT